ncbi:MAG: lysozyme [Eubacteriales bacterium]|nr:lysozyme [Eubacteriales bacterium]
MLNIENAVIEILPGKTDDSTAAEVYRNLQVLYGTVAGEQALDRDFGIDGSIIDGPQENAQALLVAEYVRKTERYEPRAKVARVDWTAGKAADGNMTPKVVIELV